MVKSSRDLKKEELQKIGNKREQWLTSILINRRGNERVDTLKTGLKSI